MFCYRNFTPFRTIRHLLLKTRAHRFDRKLFISQRFTQQRREKMEPSLSAVFFFVRSCLISRSRIEETNTTCMYGNQSIRIELSTVSARTTSRWKKAPVVEYKRSDMTKRRRRVEYEKTTDIVCPDVFTILYFSQPTPFRRNIDHERDIINRCDKKAPSASHTVYIFALYLHTKVAPSLCVVF